MLPYPFEACDVVRINLGTGFTLNVKTVRLQEDYVWFFELPSVKVSFWFCLSGNEETTFLGDSKDATINRGSGGLFLGESGLRGEARIAARTPFQIISIHMEPAALKTVLGNGYEILPQPCRRIAEEDGGGCFFHSMPITPMIRGALEQVLNCPFGEGSKQLYDEGKALEIAACLLENIKCSHAPKQPLSAADIERIHHARKLLMSDVVHPPGLMELARSVGLHHSKLNRGFREVFGNTVFGHLKETRLKRAMELLCKGRMNCAEVSFSVGYDNLSHFAKAFKEQFGANPSSFL